MLVAMAVPTRFLMAASAMVAAAAAAEEAQGLALVRQATAETAASMARVAAAAHTRARRRQTARAGLALRA